MGLILVTGPPGRANQQPLQHGRLPQRQPLLPYYHHRRSHRIYPPLKRGVVSQRQLGTDTLSYADALRAGREGGILM